MIVALWVFSILAVLSFLWVCRRLIGKVIGGILDVIVDVLIAMID